MKIVITAGPTREPLDPVRFLSNRSSGKMGYALAEAALELGHEVTLISGPTALQPPGNANFVAIVTSDELFDAVHVHAPSCALLIMCAAVCDYRPLEVATQKIKKREGDFTLRLTPTRDILRSLPREARSYFVVAFAAETHDLEKHARAKLIAKNCDAIVANDVSAADLGMESDENAVTIFFADGETETISRARKKIIARAILKKIFECMKKV